MAQVQLFNAETDTSVLLRVHGVPLSYLGSETDYPEILRDYQVNTRTVYQFTPRPLPRTCFPVINERVGASGQASDLYAGRLWLEYRSGHTRTILTEGHRGFSWSLEANTGIEP
jgi:hypothetical protein